MAAGWEDELHLCVMRIPYAELCEVLQKVLVKIGFETGRAALCARLFAAASLDGVYSHGLNRFPRFIETIKNGIVDIHTAPELVCARGAIEEWDGRQGVGNLSPVSLRERLRVRGSASQATTRSFLA